MKKDDTSIKFTNLQDAIAASELATDPDAKAALISESEQDEEISAARVWTDSPDIIETVDANCQDCYRCVWDCPVKAIQIIDGQARVKEELCVKCGVCAKVCPQRATKVTVSLERVRKLIASGTPVAATLAPTFVAEFGEKNAEKVPTALKMLGFRYIFETAEGAKRSSVASMEELHKGYVCTSCPAVVNYVERYHPEYIDKMIPIVSPMVASGRMIKETFDQCYVVFIGPCAAKKYEARRPEYADAIDGVLTFAELKEWLDYEGINVENCNESRFATTGLSNGNIDHARLYALEGGAIKTCGLNVDYTDDKVVSVSGIQEISDIFDADNLGTEYAFVEALFCNHGCINGPCFAEDSNIIVRKHEVLNYAHRKAHEECELCPVNKQPELNLAATFSHEDAVKFPPVSEEEIEEILQSTGKGSEEYRTNCGTCGYDSCQEYAIAVARGMADTDLCLPYTRRLSQQRTDRIIETSPTAVVVLDKKLNMIHMNPAFRKMFLCGDTVLGRPVSYLLNSDGYEQLAEGKTELYESIQMKYGKKFHETLYALRENEQFIGMYSNISGLKYDNKQVDLIKHQALVHAKELLAHQIKFSQEMAHYLGKSTAHTEELVNRMMELYADDLPDDGSKE